MSRNILLFICVLCLFSCQEDDPTIEDMVLGHWKNEIISTVNPPDRYYTFFDGSQVETINFSTGSPSAFQNEYRIIDSKYMEYNYGTAWTRLGPIEVIDFGTEFRVILADDAYMTFERVTREEYERESGN